MPKCPDYFIRNQESINHEQQHLLETKQVSVIGCGGLGGYVIEQLIRLGIGRVQCFDPDTFTTSNCNRQLYAKTGTIGRNKAEVAAKHAADIHPCSSITAFPVAFQKASETAVLKPDLVVDCLDNIEARLDLAGLCTQYKKPLIFGAVEGWTGQVGVQLPGGTLYSKLYPKSAAHTPQKAPSVLVCTVAMIASIQVAEALKVLLELPSELINSCLYVDLRENEYTRLDLA